jgi:cysteinyl-tRNA synthetase
MRHHRIVSQSSHHPVSSSGVLGSAGRYPLHEQPATAMRLAGRDVQPVGPLRVYACGITPYDVTHVGHASTFVWTDLVGAVAHAGGADVLLARNVTDVDDVLTESARRQGWHYDELALTQEYLFDRDMRALRVAAPALAPHARSHIVAVIRLAARLLATGAAYESDGHVWFRGAHVPERAGLDAGPALEASRAYGDQDVTADRESLFDVAVWRPSAEDDPAWPSPWGWGRPGWHAECAAMAMCSLGSAIDVLVGGADLTFPHHAYQAQMVEAASMAQPFTQTVIHVGEVRLAGAKMAKSTGNLVLVADLLQRFSGEAVRLGLLNRAWSEPWDCTEQVFAEAQGTLGELRRAAGDQPAPQHHAGVLAHLANELDVPGAVAQALEEGGPAAAYVLDVLKLREDPS